MYVQKISIKNWQTSYKLSTEVFSSGSKYMTVHQAKGLEWEKVVVSLMPNKASNRDNTTLDAMYNNPCLLEEEAAQEFTRMYYVACSRAEEDLYIHLPNNFPPTTIDTAIRTFQLKSKQKIDYGFIDYQTNETSCKARHLANGAELDR